MHSRFSTHSLLIALAAIVLLAGVYFLFSILTGHGVIGTAENKAPPLTVEEKAAVLNSVSQASGENAPVTSAEAQARQRVLEDVAQSSSDSPAAKQSDAEKAKILDSLRSQ
jgi:hypothetical protein